MILRSIYQGRVYNIMKSSDRKPDVASIDEMIEQDFDFYLYETLAARTKDFKFYNKRKVFPNAEVEEYKKKTRNSSFHGVVFHYIEQILYQNSLTFKEYILHICKERFTLNQFVFYLRKNHFIIEDIDEVLEKLFTSGIIQRIKHFYIDLRFMQAHVNANDHKALTFDQFLSIFQILVSGCAIAAMVFLIEVVMKFFRLRKFRKICS